MQIRKTVLAIIIILTFSLRVKAQGCSDAGFCTIGNLQHHEEKDSAYKHNAKLAFSYGIGEQSTNIVQVIPELEFGFFKNNSIQIKILYVIASGNLGNNNGIGDLSFSITQKLIHKEHSAFSSTLGIKLPTGTTDANDGNMISLPMPYQTGLGTTDLILGISYQFKNWNFGAGYQTVLKNENKNTFYYGETFAPIENPYFESRFLDRGDDALLRIERNFTLKKIKLSAGLLGIFRLQKDKITDLSETQVEVIGSDGLTLNITGNAQYDFSKHTGVNISFGTPLIVRDVRPDGLTRKLVLTAGFNYRFGK